MTSGPARRLDDGVSFMHIAASEDGQNPLPGVAAFQVFQAGIGGRCAAPPVVTEVTLIGSHHMFGA